MVFCLKRKIKKGRYDHALAPKLWMFLMDNGSKNYRREVADGTEFNKNTRMAAAKEMADRELQNILDNQYGSETIIGKGNKGPGF